MTALVYRFDISDIRRQLGSRFAGMSAAMHQAEARGLNEGGDKVRTAVQRALWRQTSVKNYRSITSRVRTTRAFEGSLSYTIIATGKGIPIREFPVRLTGAGVVAQVWGVAHQFQRSFGEKDHPGVEGFRARLGASRLPIRKFYGPALPKELGKGESANAFYRAASEFVPPAILKHLARAL
jgi:hypothetical protein